MAINQNPDFLEEVMFAEHGTRVLITDPASDRYLEEHKKRRLRQKFDEHWFADEDGY